MKNKFKKQFLISKEGVVNDNSFANYKLVGQVLSVEEDLPVTRVLFEKQTIGYLLGWPIKVSDESLLDGEYTVHGLDEQFFDEFVEIHIYCLSGSFIFISALPNKQRLYLDCNGTLSAIYSRCTQEVASTAELVLAESYRGQLDKELIIACEVKNNGWITAGLTAHNNIRRLLANHYLDLDSFSAYRHWPSKPLSYEADSINTIHQIGSEILSVINAITKKNKVYVTLTAGNETRAILAALRPVAGSLNFVTINNPKAPLDYVVACKLAKQFKVNHITLPIVIADEETALEWDKKVGNCLTGNNRLYHPSVGPLSDGITIGGLGGEVGRCFLWDTEKPQGPITAIGLVDSLKLSRDPKVLSATEEWLGNIPPFLDCGQVLDLAYIELRMSTWAYAQAYANPAETIIHPFTSRQQFIRIMSLSPEFRWDNGLIRNLVDELWRELNEIPINAYGDIRDKFEYLRRGLSSPQKLLPKLRKLFRTKLKA